MIRTMLKKTAILTILCLGILLPVHPVAAEQPCSAPEEALQCYFPETGHTVSGEFLAFYRKARDPEQVYGYPITEAFQQENPPLMVQYFQKARLEYYPQAAEGEKVRLTPLGERSSLLINFNDKPIPINPAACLTFNKTNHTVCYEFLEYFNQYGGLAQFGYPLSDIGQAEGHTVQLFEYARLEWQPDYPSGRRVIPADLGSEFFQVSGESPSRLRPVEAVLLSQPSPKKLVQLRTHAFPVKQTRANISGDQDVYTLFVIVKDQNQMPVPGASVEYALIKGGGEETHAIPLPTNEEGITSTTFNVAASRTYEMVHMQVRVKYGDFSDQTATAFWSGN